LCELLFIIPGNEPPGTKALKKLYNFNVVFDGATKNTNTKISLLNDLENLYGKNMAYLSLVPDCDLISKAVGSILGNMPGIF